MEILNLICFGIVFYAAIIAVPSLCEGLEKRLS